MKELSRFAAIFALLALLAGPVLACVMAQAAPGHDQEACQGQKSHGCESALSHSSPACCTISSHEDLYLAVRADLPAPLWTPEATDALFATALAEDEESSVAGNGWTFSPPSSPSTAIAVLRI